MGSKERNQRLNLEVSRAVFDLAQKGVVSTKPAAFPDTPSPIVETFREVRENLRRQKKPKNTPAPSKFRQRRLPGL